MKKRTRPIRGDYFLTIPRITHEGRILEIKVKLSQVIVTDLGPAKKRGRVTTGDAIPPPTYAEVSEETDELIGEIETGSIDGHVGEIERGSVDGEERHETQ